MSGAVLLRAAKRGELKAIPNPYEVVDPASVSWLAGYRGTVVKWRDEVCKSREKRETRC
jgi:hypothetical protein